jgi:hypothetical protein
MENIDAWGWIGTVAVLAFLAISPGTPTELLSAPVSDILWKRYDGDSGPQNADRALAYIHREADRQINKVRGILTFDGIFFVVARTDFMPSTLFGRAALSYLLVSIMVSLYLFFVKWGDTSVYEGFRLEFMFATKEIRRRTWLVNYAVIMSALAAFGVSLSMLFHINLKLNF